ncbi:Essential protein Yae1, N terminal [Aspergillus alliaceus]|uniref:Protein YAE1 n=1 Tax=Petromyces alliaceus TaxID=209559 RepID=A0A5N6G5V1_PETAA|nr:uncharacterized protein BDW43DRAFT_228755 [Aspergillus alliaceus]KAB8236985.1 hypothetical protein BDW43DRAFT_228755 [Aspergillus alliaceus]KAF5857081.1 Essential protein Yae1, N terminal [Aspergillus burnettii]
MTSPSETNNNLDDIFGSSPPHEEHVRTVNTNPNADLSELPSLRRQHVTAGYRDGVSASKGEHVQAGFDAGFPIGAQLGMRAGTVLGILEGLLRGYESRTASAVVKKPGARGGASSTPTESEEEVKARLEKREKILKLYQSAVKDLDVQAVFAGLDGTNDGLKPEEKLRALGDAAVSPWEGKVHVAEWEANMDALEPKNMDAEKGQEGEGRS